MPRLWLLAVGLVALGLAGCASGPAPPAPASTSAPAPIRPPAVLAAERQPARWIAADWSALPGWADDRVSEWWQAFRQSCRRASHAWQETCARAALESPADDAATRAFLAAWLQPWRVQAADGQTEGLATGYFEPQLEASRRPRDGFRVAVHAPPADLATRRPHFARHELDTMPAAQAALRGREIAWIEDPIDLMLLQVQGSGRLRITEPDGSVQWLRVAFAGHNDHPFRSPARWLIEQGELRAEQASWQAVRAWALQNPDRVSELLRANPRVVYFRAEPLPEGTAGPRGAQGVPLTPGRSVAVDPGAVPYGTPLWIDTTEPVTGAPLRRLVMAQDTGSAIVGAVRIDYFWGTGDAAQTAAGRMKFPVRKWALWPKGLKPPGG
jgi:membrane-bound lytic murein transglycosylase A